MTKVIKREGKHVDFEVSRIEKAVRKAQKEINCDGADASMIAKSVKELVDSKNEETVNVEDLQNYVISEIRKAGFDELANVYSSFREKKRKEKAAKKFASMLEHVAKSGEPDVMLQAARKLLGADVDNQNANIDGYSFGGRMGEANGILTKYIALNYCMSPRSRANHENNEIYIHDLDSYAVGMHNCLTISFGKLLENGFKTKNVDIRPANSLSSALQLIAVIFQIQSLNQFGGIGCIIDYDLVPYLRISFYKHYKDAYEFLNDGKKFECDKKPRECQISDPAIYELNSKYYEWAVKHINKELEQGMEGLFHNLNSIMSRSANQLPFSSLNYLSNTTEEGEMLRIVGL